MSVTPAAPAVSVSLFFLCSTTHQLFYVRHRLEDGRLTVIEFSSYEHAQTAVKATLPDQPRVFRTVNELRKLVRELNLPETTVERLVEKLLPGPCLN